MFISGCKKEYGESRVTGRMNCAILTFQCAHNYGAALQCYALKYYLSGIIDNVYVIPFKPREIWKTYSINPFYDSLGVREVMTRLFSLRCRVSQYMLFQSFIKTELGCYSRGSYEDYKCFLNKSDIVICGSDQIWNDMITGMRKEYYAHEIRPGARRISYAASFGRTELDDFQRACIREELADFSHVSLREEDGAREIFELIGKQPEIVMDPVFLPMHDVWDKLAESSRYRTYDNYILYYSLQDDSTLNDKTCNLSEQTGLPIRIVHPIGTKQKITGKQLYNVGPCEFLYLLKNADYVCTNSFHAVAFSAIFRKKMMVVPPSQKERRITSLLKRLGVPIDNSIVDWHKQDADRIESLSAASRLYLCNALEM